MSSSGNGQSAGGKLILSPGTRLEEVVRLAPLDPMETRILLSHALGISRVQLITQSERLLTPEEAGRVSLLLSRRMSGEPVAYIIGEREFFGLMFRVTPDVLIPRPETELLVELALERLPPGGSVLDLGTGSGAVAVALAHERPDSKVTALDASAAALDVARENAERNLAGKARIAFVLSDWFSALPADARFDLIVGNPPYISADDPHLAQGDLRFEPSHALTDRADGLAAIRLIATDASGHLNPRGWLLLEHGYDQAQAVRDLFVANGYESVQSWRDLAGIERVTGGMLPVSGKPLSA